jgi:hypothetical protein
VDTDGVSGGKVEAMNASVRSLCVILLVATFCGVFILGSFRKDPVVSTDAFVGILAAAITWLFKSRDEKQQQGSQTTVTKTTETDPSGAKREVTSTTPTIPAPASPVLVVPVTTDPPKGATP